ncbi:alpha-hydroxy-acid oxidizing protein [Janibacter hoylei]|uniref:alpha-hydroxy-acid oxidizing protein n=1 Tax=Janibacter hoylei TaxID=364298 RepID=UPI0021A370EF|nr:alpha-hydroxy-acid oxidizing protein [Janibacter hoylei]MCT1619862.1 alpha-hydroxy-acid oxidizing protein [Janibacter hoylei]MCT2294051.1 alpha-hydroxy-acid oxidizing protein [Janibacter hoylei]
MTTPQPSPGRARQDAIYRPGALGIAPTVPTDVAELERRARAAMSRKAWAYIAGGAGGGATMRANRAAFDRWRVVPRMLHATTTRDLSTALLGTELTAPLLLAPVGAAGLVTDDADLLIAQGAHASGVPYVFSCQGCSPMEETAQAMAGTPFWYQLYWSTDEALVDSMIARAEAVGAQALVVTLDTTMLGWRTQDLDLGSLPFARGLGIAQYTSDPRFMQLVRERLADTARAAQSLGIDPRKPLRAARAAKGGVGTLLSMSREHPGGVRDNLRSPEPRAAVETFLDIYSNPALSWEHIATLRERTSLPVVLKGILHEDDARQAFDSGVDAVVVSNHGGRQVDRSIAALDALVRVREAVGPEPTVLMDSGVRSGADLFVALALGADACLLGRPHLYGLALDGAAGVSAVVDNVLAELDLTMGLVGAATIGDITRELLVEA